MYEWRGKTNRCVNYAAMNNTSKAPEYHQQAAKAFEAAGDQNGVAKVYNAIGSTYLTLNEHYRDALLYFNKAIDLCKTQHNNALLPYPLMNKAIAYKNIDSIVPAFQAFKEALVLCRQYTPEKKECW